MVTTGLALAGTGGAIALWAQAQYANAKKPLNQYWANEYTVEGDYGSLIGAGVFAVGLAIALSGVV